jgi:hypothetical protein
MFIVRRDSAILLCSEERHSFEPRCDGQPLFRTEPEEDGLAGYKHCTPPEWRP